MQFSPPGFLDKNLGKILVKSFKIFLVQDNSRSYQGFQEVTGICGKIQDLGKSFKIFYTGLRPPTSKLDNNNTTSYAPVPLFLRVLQYRRSSFRKYNPIKKAHTCPKKDTIVIKTHKKQGSPTFLPVTTK